MNTREGKLAPLTPDARRCLEPLRDFFQHHLGRAAADRLHAGIARHALDRRFAHVTHAAMELQGGVHHLVHQFAAVGLGHRDFARAVDALRVEEGRGFYAIMSNFQNERTVIGAMAMGEAQAALELTIDYVTTRKAFGGTLYEKQGIRQRLAMLAAKVEAGRQLVYHAAFLDAQGVDCTREVSIVKAYCSELVNEVMYACLQFHGGTGYMREQAIERMARDARVQAIGGGATEVMLEEVAKRMRR